MLTSKLFLVDLGGSEQVKKSKAEGVRFQEAVKINKSLAVLGRVVDALVNKNAYHVPRRPGAARRDFLPTGAK